MAPSNIAKVSVPPSLRLERLVRDALDVARKAKRYRNSLNGDNFYANKLASLRADATNAFRELAFSNAGDTSALAEMIENVFAAATHLKQRTETARNLVFSLQTNWKTVEREVTESEGLFPLSILSQAKRAYLITVGRQMNGCFTSGWYDASAVMMRRLLEISIIEAFEAHTIANKIKDAAGDYLQLSELVRVTLAESSWNLSRNAKKSLPQLRELGHKSAHGRYYSARKEDIESVRLDCRVVVEELLHIAKLL
jgi:hypothetical protein